MTGGLATRKWTSLAPASLTIFTSWRAVVPRTTESSTITTTRSFRTPSTGLNLHRTFSSRASWPGEMKVRPM